MKSSYLTLHYKYLGRTFGLYKVSSAIDEWRCNIRISSKNCLSTKNLLPEFLWLLPVNQVPAELNSAKLPCIPNFKVILKTLVLHVKLMSTIFYFFTKWQSFKNYEKKLFISPKKLFSFSRYLTFCIFSFPFHTFQI